MGCGPPDSARCSSTSTRTSAFPAAANWEHWARELPVGALGGIPGPEATRPSSVLADAAE
jgi:hypothetical protein